MDSTPQPDNSKPKFLTARERQQARANGTLVEPAKENRATPLPPLPQCEFRGWEAIGKMHCNCSHQPEVWECFCPLIPSGLCSPTRGSAREFGKLIYPDGTKGDETLNTFRFREGRSDSPRDYEVVYCDSCPHQTDPPPQIARLKRLGIVGNHDPATGTCDVLHVMPPPAAKPERIEVAGMGRQCVVIAARDKPLSELVEATSCRLLIVYGAAASPGAVKEVATANEHLKVWMVAQDARLKRQEIANVWYDLPADLADDLAQRTKAAYAVAVARILE